MRNSEAKGEGETTAFPRDGDPGQPESAWCEDELTLDMGGGTEEDEETLPLEESYGMASLNNPDLWLYRDRTSAILRRYLRLAVEVGRGPVERCGMGSGQ